MRSYSGRAMLQSLLLAIRTTSLFTLGPIGAFGSLGPGIVGGLFGCPFSIPFILCPICPIPCTFNLIRSWLFGGIFATSLLMGRVFCGLLCPLGIVSDLLFRSPVKKLPVSGVNGRLRYIKYGAVILFLYLMSEAAAILLGLVPVWSLWSFLTVFREEMAIIIVAAVLIVLISSVFIYRPWCRYICPIGTLLSASNRFSLLSLERDVDECKGCDACIRSCPLSLHDSSDSTDCFRCLSCYTACSRGLLRIRTRKIGEIFEDISKT